MKETLLDSMEYQEVLKLNIENLKKQKLDLDRQVLISNVTLKNNEESLIVKRQEFEGWKTREVKKAETEKNQILNSVIQSKEQIRVSQDNIQHRSQELFVRESNCLKIEEERREINDRMISVEKLASQARLELENVTRMKQEAQSKLNLASEKEITSAKKLLQAETLNGQLATREEIVKSRELEVEEKLKNVEEVRKIIEPKIEELKILEESNKRILEEIHKGKSEIESKILEDKELMKTLTEKDKKLRDKEIELTTKSEEVGRRLLMIEKRNKE